MKMTLFRDNLCQSYFMTKGNIVCNLCVGGLNRLFPGVNKACSISIDARTINPKKKGFKKLFFDRRTDGENFEYVCLGTYRRRANLSLLGGTIEIIRKLTGFRVNTVLWVKVTIL